MKRVVGELIPTVSDNNKGLMPTTGFIYRGIVGKDNITDFNQCNKNGFYKIDKANEIANSPGFDWGVLLSFNAEGYYLNLAFSTTNGNISVRTGTVGDGFSKWYKHISE